VLEHLQNVIHRHDNKIKCLMMNLCGVKCANKSVSARNYELFRSSDLHEYTSHIVELDIAGGIPGTR